jgi:hypothetical protein
MALIGAAAAAGALGLSLNDLEAAADRYGRPVPRRQPDRAAHGRKRQCEGSDRAVKMTQNSVRPHQSAAEKARVHPLLLSEEAGGAWTWTHRSQEDFEKLPFTWKGDLREAYTLG